MRFALVGFLIFLARCVDQKKAELDAWIELSRATGGLRSERDPTDAPIDAALLATNFRKIAYDLELDPFGIGEELPEEDQRPYLKRWTDKITLQVVSGPNVSASADIDAHIFMERLSEISGVNVAIADDYLLKREPEGPTNLLVFMGDGEFFDMVLDEIVAQEQRADGDREGRLRYFHGFVELWHSAASPCGGTFFTTLADDGVDTGQIRAAIVLIRTDLAAPNTQSCIEEELAQVMGLPNDDSTVRPSLFNDDEEFAFMTRHDELLLRILYDARLRPGMSPEQSMPIVRQIARELLPDS